MPWQCVKCHSINANINDYCAYCRGKFDLSIKPPEAFEYFDESEFTLIKVLKYKCKEYLGYSEGTEMAEFEKKLEEHKQIIADGKYDASHLSPAEQKFAHFFADTVQKVKDMSDMELRAFRESLVDVIKEGNARLNGVEWEQRERNKKKGIKAVVDNVDPNVVSTAIKNITERTKKLTKQEKQIDIMVNTLGIDRKEAERMFLASTVLQAKKKGTNTNESTKQVSLDSIVNQIVGTASENSGTEIKSEDKPAEITTNSEQPKEEVKEEVKKKPFNPFEV